MIATKPAPLPPSDQNQRKIAASEIDENIIVLAGAGTGKTTILIDRLSFLILGKETPIERIVALTFTKKAAEEMRERLEIRLREVLQNPDRYQALWDKFPKAKERAHQNAVQALNDIPKAQIGTIHSFAGYLLRLFPIQANVDPKFREDEGEVFDVLFEQEWKLWIAEELKKGGLRTDLWSQVLSLVPIEDIKKLAKQISSPNVPLESLKNIVDILPLLKESLRTLESLRSTYPHPAKAHVFLEGLRVTQDIFETLIKGERWSDQQKEAVKNLTIDKPPKGWEEAKETLKILKKRAKTLPFVDSAMIEKCIDILTPFINRFRLELRQKGVVSFSGSLVFARNLLRDYKDVRREIKKQFDFFLVDEFQDTDPLQGEILFYLSEKEDEAAPHWNKVNLEKGRLFVVGDPKQSIYRFRGADIAAFESFRNAMVDQRALETTLSHNFRSQPGLLDPVNEMFPLIMKKEPYIQSTYSPLYTGRTQQSKNSLEMICIKENKNEKSSAQTFRRLESIWIAKWVKEHVGKELDGRKLEYRDCALLFRSANAFGEYLNAFREFGIPYLAEGEKFFYQTMEVTEFLNLLAAISSPEDKLSLVGVLRSPLGGLSDPEIYQLKKKEGLDYRTSPALFREKISDLFETLKTFHERSYFVPVGTLIQNIFDETWVLELTSQSRYGEQAWANIVKIKSLADHWSKDNPLTLQAFVKRFKSYREDEKEEGENPLADVRYDAVKLLTIHKSKGLEFPVVFLPNLCALTGANQRRPQLIQDWRSGHIGIRLEKSGITNSALPLMEEEIARREKAEEVRVFYVASTRAKDHMFYFLRENPPRASQYANYIKAAGKWPTTPESGKVHFVSSASKPLPFSRPLLKEKLTPEWNPISLARNDKQRRKEWNSLASIPVFSSPSSEIKTKKESDAVEYEKWNFGSEDERQRAEAIKIGLLCHKVMEKWPFEMPPQKIRKALKELISRFSHLFELIPGEASSQKILDESEEILDRFFSSPIYRKIQKAKIIGREMPFIYKIDSSKEGKPTPAVMRGVIDIVYEKEGRLIIGDYKTNRMSEKKATELKEVYRTQANIYKKAIRKTLGRDSMFELIFLRNGFSCQI